MAPAFAAPGAASQRLRHERMTAMETVMRCGGGLGESGTRTTGPGESSARWWGKSEQMCPSGPIPINAVSKECAPMRRSHVRAKAAPAFSRPSGPYWSAVGARTSSTPGQWRRKPAHASSSLREGSPAAT